jgi:hypothetical protein
MAPHRPRQFSVERLEDRQMLSGANPSVPVSTASAVVTKGAVLPYVELTLKGHFVANAPTTVTFAGKHQATITVIPTSVSKSTVEVAVPAFFDARTGQPVSATVAVSVHQEVGGRSKNVQILKSLSVARLPQTGLLAGDVLGAVTTGAATITSLTASNIALLAQRPGVPLALQQAASGVVADLTEIGILIPQAEQALVSLAFGVVSSVPLGTFQGKPASLDANQLGLLDRIIAAGIDDAAGTTSQGVALVSTLDSLVLGAVAAGPSAVIDRALGVVDVLNTALGSPVVPPGTVETGLALGSLSAVVAVAAAEALVVQGAFSPSSTLGPADLAMVDKVLEAPALGQALNAITTGLVPSSPAGLALIEAARIAEDLAAQIDPNVPGSAGARLMTYLESVPLHQG